MHMGKQRLNDMKTLFGVGRPRQTCRPIPVAAMALITAAMLSLTGCASSDEVEVKLPFVGDIMKKTQAKEEKLATRGTLVLPPKADSLPEPSDEKTAAANGVESWPQDPDLTAKQQAEVAAAKQREYEKDGDWKNERSTGNGLEDFENKTNWSKRQTGVLDKLINGQ